MRRDVGKKGARIIGRERISESPPMRTATRLPAFAVLSDGSMLVASNVNRDGGTFSEVLHVDSSGIEIRRSPARRSPTSTSTSRRDVNLIHPPLRLSGARFGW